MSTAIKTQAASGRSLFESRAASVHSVAAFTLVEVALAIGVVSFCLIVLFGLLSVGLDSNRSAIEQAGANQVLSAVVADFYATPRSAANSSQYAIPIPANPETGSTNTLYFLSNLQTNKTAASSIYALTVVSTPESTGRMATFLDLKVTWPAAAKLANASGKVETFVALNRN